MGSPLPDWMRGMARGAARPRPAARISAEAIADALLRPGSADTDRKKLRDVARLLAETPSGADDLQLLVQHALIVEFDTRAGGAGYRPAMRRIILNRTHTAARTATELVHEATHARLKMERRGADLHHDARQEYVDNMI